MGEVSIDSRRSNYRFLAGPLFEWASRHGKEFGESKVERLERLINLIGIELEEGGLCAELSAQEWLKELQSMKPLVGKIGEPQDKVNPPILYEIVRTNESLLRVYLNRDYRSERDLARSLALFFGPKSYPGFDEGKARDLALSSELSLAKELADIVFSQGLCVIYGGPGTGKTTQLKKIIRCFLAGNPKMRIYLAAPTGKAASRMKKGMDVGVDLPAHTIHHWLYTKQENGEKPGQYESGVVNTACLDCDLLVVDEASMIDINLAQRLLSVINPERTRLILMGDAYQLQAVGPGSFFSDICHLGDQKGFSYCLKVSHRFWSKSPVGIYATEIKKAMGGEPDDQGEVSKTEDCADPEPIAREILGEHITHPPVAAQQWIKKQIEKYACAVRTGNPVEIWKALGQFKALSATREGPLGVESLNALASRLLKESLGDQWCEDSGQAIIVTVNDKDHGVYNGDIGVILPRKSKGEPARVYFGDIVEGESVKVLSLGALSYYEPAFAITVHKSQGSEFHDIALFLPLDRKSSLARKELLYTGVTRVSDTKDAEGKAIREFGKLVIFSGNSVEKDIIGGECFRRKSGLPDRLTESFH